MFSAIQQAKPGFLALPPKGESPAWFDSTIVLTALGFYMWPHSFGSVFTARRERVFRQNAIVMPLYQLILAFVFFVGFAAVLKVPGLSGPQIDLALFRVSIQSFDPWLTSAGVIAGIVVGIATVAATSLTHTTMATLFPGLPEAVRDLNIGIVALVLNVVTLAVVSALTGRVALAHSA
jgi:SSS family solute:Na+ symporter